MNMKVKMRFLALFLSVTILFSVNVYATSDEQLKEELEAARDELQVEIDSVQAELDKLRADENVALEYQELLSEKINLIEEQVIESIETIERLNLAIAELDARIETAELEYADTLAKLKDRIITLYQSGSVSTLEMLLDSSSLNDFAYRTELLKATASFDKELMDDITEFVNLTKDDREERDTQKENVAQEKIELEANKEELSVLYEENAQLVEELTEQKLIVEDEMATLENENAEYNAQISALIAKKAAEEAAAEAAAKAEAEAAAKAEAEAAAKEEAENGGTEDDTETTTPPTTDTGSSSDDGFNPIWPIPGYGYGSITQNYRYGGHWGLDVGIPMMTPIVASDDGEVLSAEYRWDWGNNVLIYHDSTYSTRYAHLETMSVSAGQAVVKGQIIGYSGSTGQSTGPHLHFEIYKNGSRVDPLGYV